MARVELVLALKELMNRGIWETKDGLMGEVIRVRPSNFAQLTDEDAFRIINRGNDIVLSHGKPPVYIEPFSSNNSEDEKKETVGRCIDLWKNDDILSDTPKRKSIRFPEAFLDGGLLPPKPIAREQYSGNFTIDFGSRDTVDLRKVDLGRIEEAIVESYPMYTSNFSLPIRDYPTSAGKTFTITKIKTIGSDEV